MRNGRFKSGLTFLTLVAMSMCAGEALSQRGGTPPPVGPVGVAPVITPDARSAQLLQQKAAVAAAVRPVTDAMMLNTPAEDWLMWRRTYDVHGYSPLNQITRQNVRQLRSVWAWSIAPFTVEDTPLIHDGVMYVYGSGDHLQALDATNGELLWSYDRPPLAAGTSRGSSFRRNIALYQDKVYFSTDDRHMVAINAKTGKLVWDHPMGGQELGNLTGGPMVVKGKVIQGTAQCAAGGCPIIAMDANDGHEAWRFYTVAKTGEPGGDTRNGLPDDQRFGASLWDSGSYDPELNLVYFGTGNTYHWQELMKGNVDPKKRTKSRDGLYVDSTLAINPDTGKLVWYYQHLPQDYWDLDFAFEQTIATMTVKGKPTKVVCSTGKMVWTDCVDAATGQFLFAHDHGLQNIIKSYDPKTGRKTYNEEAIPDLTGQRRNLQCSAGYGDKNWPAGSYDAATQVTYESLVEVCGESAPHMLGVNNEAYKANSEETRMARYQQGSDGNIGRLDAVNWATGKILWSTRQRASMTGATVATAGGVIFTGDADRYLKAFDQTNGKQLWQSRLNDVINAWPVTYSVKGKQYVAVITGCCGNGRINNMHQLTPEIEQPKPTASTVWVFALPDANE